MNNNKIKVLNVSNYYKPHIGGIEQLVHDISDSLIDECEQKVICFNSEKESKVEVVDGVEVTYIGSFAKVASQSLCIGYGRALKKIIREYEPDVVIFHYPNPFVATKLMKHLKNRKFKFIIWWHLDITKQKLLKLFFEPQNQELLKYADKIVATSPNYIEGSKYLSSVKEKCIVIPSCVNEHRIAYTDINIKNAKDIKDKYSGKTILFAFGRHVEYKGLKYLIKASKLLDDRFVVLIGGEGPLTKSLKELAQDDKKVVFLGRLTDSQLKDYLIACDIFCFPSITKNEAFGIGLAESLYYGKPSITFNIPGSGVNYVSVDELTCTEVENCNYHAYANAIMDLASDENKYLTYKNNALERVKLFSYDLFKENVKNLIFNICEKND